MLQIEIQIIQMKQIRNEGKIIPMGTDLVCKFEKE